MVERHEKGSSIMNAKALIGTVIETIIKVLVLAAAIILVFKGATKAYQMLTLTTHTLSSYATIRWLNR